VTASTILNVAHGLAVVPQRINVVLRNVTTENGFAANDETFPVAGLGVMRDATNVKLMQAATVSVAHKTTGAVSTITVGNWRWVVEAWR
jgi:hypothetical protein